MPSELSGVIPIDKPPGVSSRRVVDAVARGLGMATVGHAGTLDPLASGVVVVCVGHATRLVDFLHDLPKAYSATFLLGRSSPSDDLETAVEEERNPIRPDRHAIKAAARQFHGEILQRPCDYSAVHVAGKRAYRLARQGREMAIPPKRVRIDRLVITGYEWPRLAIDVVCSSGTFIRAIGRDLAAALGTKAVMESLVRTAVGPFTRGDSLPLATVTPDSIRAALRPPLAAVPHLPRFVLAGDVLERAVRGALIDVGSPAPVVAAIDTAGDLVGILKQHASGSHRLRPNFRGAGAPPRGPTVLVVMGVSGSGKTTVAAAAAARLGWRFQEGDALHPPANIAKMSAGIPLTDEDREPWLAAVAAWIDGQLARNANGIITCSALKRAYRERIVGARSGVRLIYLRGDEGLIAGRLAARSGHFMPPELLQSQFATLEEPAPEEQPITVDIGADVDATVGEIVRHLER